MLKKVKGLIIKETNVGEGDKILTILTHELGKIQAVANGARSYKSKFIAGCQLFCYTDFVLSQKKDLHRVSSAQPVETFFSLRNNLEKLSLAAYFCDLLCEVATDSSDADEVLRLALNTFYILTKKDDHTKIKAVFELRLMCLSGFMPQLYYCSVCGTDKDISSFSISDAEVCCSRCATKGEVLSGTVLAMQHIASSEPKRLFSFEASDDVLFELSSIAENYILCQIGRDFRSLKYYLTISKNMI